MVIIKSAKWKKEKKSLRLVLIVLYFIKEILFSFSEKVSAVLPWGLPGDRWHQDGGWGWPAPWCRGRWCRGGGRRVPAARWGTAAWWPPGILTHTHTHTLQQRLRNLHKPPDVNRFFFSPVAETHTHTQTCSTAQLLLWSSLFKVWYRIYLRGVLFRIVLLLDRCPLDCVTHGDKAESVIQNPWNVSSPGLGKHSVSDQIIFNNINLSIWFDIKCLILIQTSETSTENQCPDRNGYRYNTT